jgi:esterase/lipase superfamily enzyme
MWHVVLENERKIFAHGYNKKFIDSIIVFLDIIHRPVFI